MNPDKLPQFGPHTGLVLYVRWYLYARTMQSDARACAHTQEAFAKYQFRPLKKGLNRRHCTARGGATPPPPLPPFFLPTIYFITLTIYICRAILRAALLLVGLAPVGQNFMRNIGLLINKGKRIVEGEEEQHSDTVHPGIFNFVQELLIAFWVDKVYATTIEKRLWQWRNKEQP